MLSSILPKNKTKKNTLTWLTTIHSTVKSIFYVFCTFLEKLKTQKIPFEINWPLVENWKFDFKKGLDSIVILVVFNMSWGCWKHHFGIPGVRPIFLKPEWSKESKNGFKTINFRPYRIVIFSNYFFRYQISLKKLDGFTSN